MDLSCKRLTVCLMRGVCLALLMPRPLEERKVGECDGHLQALKGLLCGGGVGLFGAASRCWKALTAEVLRRPF